MELKRVIAKDSASATEKILATYGRDALIISNRRIKNQTEVIVAVDLMSEPLPRLEGSAETGAPGSAPPERSPPAPDRLDAPVAKGAAIFADLLADSLGEQNATLPGRAFRPGVPALDESNAVAPSPAGMPELDELNALVRSEFKAVRTALDFISHQITTDAHDPGSTSLDQGSDAPESGVIDDTPAGYSLDIPRGLLEQLSPGLSRITNTVSLQARLRLALTEKIRLPENDFDFPETIHTLSGPDASGKTTMAIKFAISAAKRVGANQVAIISYKNSEIGTWQQVEFVASRIGIDYFRAETDEDLSFYLDELHDCRFVIIDAGNENGASRLPSVVSLLKEKALFEVSSHHLVLAADFSGSCVRRYLRTTTQRWNDMFLTRIDNCEEFWPPIDVALNRSLTISLTNDAADLLSPLPQWTIRPFVDRITKPMNRATESS